MGGIPPFGTAPGVNTLRKTGDTKLKKDVTLSEGANITLTQVGQDIEIAGGAGGSGSMTTVKEDGVQVGGADIVTLDFLNGFDITESPNTEINVALDLGEYTGADLPVAAGGTGASTAQAAIDTLTDVGSATNEHILTKDTATGNAIFKVNSGGGATTALDNLASVAINLSLVSDTDITDDLGTGDIRWRDVYPATIRAGLTAADTLKLEARDVDGASWTTFLTLTSANTPTADLAAGVTINSNAIAFSGGAFHDGFSDFVANEHIDHSAVTLTAGVGLSGGGDISSNRTFTVDLNELTTETTIAAGDFISMVDITDSGSGKITFANLESTISHDNIAGVSSDDHHAQSHTVASHSDTTATGAELETLTDGSDADALHVHSGASLNDDIFLLNNGDIGTGVYDFGGADSFEIPNSATPTVNAAGEIAIDTTITDHTALIRYYGAEELIVIAVPTDKFNAVDGNVIAYNATNNEFEMTTAAGGGDVTGDTASADKELVRFNGTSGKAIESPVTDLATTTATLSDNADLTLYDAVNDGNPVIAFGSSATERLQITASYASGGQSLEFVEFDTPTASATADRGEYRFKVDATLVATIDDGGLEIKASGSLSFGAVDILTDSAGTTTLNNIDALDATTEATIETAIDTLSNLTTTGALDAGSITSNFGTINTGASAITTTGDITGGGIHVTGDTAAADNAALGYTSTEGLILTGQGSSNDVTIKNDADATVLSIATGATNVDIVGDVTALTVNADGDTSAGDNAAMGYTATEGLVLTGQGSTTDVTIKNDADATILSIPTGTSTVTLGADGTVSSLILTEKASIALDPAGGADGDYSGITVAGTAGAALSFGDLVYLAAADSRWELADADAASTSGDVMLGIVVLAAAADGNATTILLHGTVRADAAFPALTVSAQVYVGTTAGDIQVAQPTGTDDVIRVVGRALTANEIYFNPSEDYITHT